MPKRKAKAAVRKDREKVEGQCPKCREWLDMGTDPDVAPGTIPGHGWMSLGGPGPLMRFCKGEGRKPLAVREDIPGLGDYLPEAGGGS